jgi:anti-sigma regulatory factor (Ser/Thr protein kinase)
MSLIRHGIRFAAHRGQDPADILAVVDAALRDESPDLTATAFVAIVDIRESRVRYASAGHPPAALRQPNGRVRMLTVEPAPPLGSWPEGLRPRVEASPLVYGSLLVLYTDGLTEIDRDPIDGERRLIAALRDDAAFVSTNPARYVRDAVIDERPVRDDVAVITLAYGRRAGWSFEAPDALRAQPARASFERWLAQEAEGDAYVAALVFGELVGNVVRHAPGPIEMRAEWRDEELVLHVFDSGPGFEAERGLPDASSEGGRGLYIVRTLARDVVVAPNPRGTRVSVRLPVARKRHATA